MSSQRHQWSLGERSKPSIGIDLGRRQRCRCCLLFICVRRDAQGPASDYLGGDLSIILRMARKLTVEQELQELRDQLRHHEYLYFIEDSPELTDAQYDALMNKLKKMEGEHPELLDRKSVV